MNENVVGRLECNLTFIYRTDIGRVVEDNPDDIQNFISRKKEQKIKIE